MDPKEKEGVKSLLVVIASALSIASFPEVRDCVWRAELLVDELDRRGHLDKMVALGGKD